MGWWTLQVVENIRHIAVVQVDLSGHSGWAASAVTGPDRRRLASARAQFPAVLDVRLRFLGFARVYGLYDGGLYAKLNDATALELAAAGREVLGWFRSWNAQHAEGKLELRATATWLPKVVIDPDPSYWFSPELNKFLKDERALGEAGSFIVTGTMVERMRLHSEADTQEYFEPVPGKEVWRLRLGQGNRSASA